MELYDLIKLVNYESTIIVNRTIARAVGLNEAVIYSALISKFCWYQEHNKAQDGWFYSTAVDLQESTTLTTRQQDLAIKHLVDAGLIEKKVCGIPPKRFFRVSPDLEKLKNVLNISENNFHPEDNTISTERRKQSLPSVEENIIIKHNVKNIRNKNDYLPSSRKKEAYGEFKNVFLTDEEVEKLKAKFDDWEERIERLSEYIASKGKKYKSHYATILTWGRKKDDNGEKGYVNPFSLCVSDE